MKNIVINTLLAAQEQVENRPNTLEMYGLDLMMDDKLNVWLIEVNSSPAMDYSTEITERMVQEISEDIAKVVVDNNHGRKKNLGDIGKFVCIYRDNQVFEKPTFYLNFSLGVYGNQIRKLDKI